MNMTPVSMDASLWKQVVGESHDATFFQTPTWVEIVTKTYPAMKNATVACTLDDGKMAVLPLVSTSVGPGGMFCRYLSMWPGVYGGVVCSGRLDTAEMASIYTAIGGPRCAGGYVIGNPLVDRVPGETVMSNTLTTHMVDLRDGIDGVWQRMESSFRRRVKRGRENGVTVAPAESQADFEAYYQIYQDSQRRWADNATSSYPYELFENIRQAAAKNGKSIRLWLARRQDRVCAGAMVFYEGCHAVSWHAATLQSEFAASPANVLQMTILEDACQRGFEWYDLNPSGEHAGVARFKVAMGATEHTVRRLTLRSGMLWKVYRRATSSKLRRAG